MDMTEGCSTCMRATDNNITHCMLPFEGIKCSPCDVNLLRHMDECNRAGLSNDICGIDNLLHVSDQCAACLVLRDEDDTAIDCMPDPAPGQCLIEDWSGMDAVNACPDGDEACASAAMSMLSDVRLTRPTYCRLKCQPTNRPSPAETNACGLFCGARAATRAH